MSTIPLAAVCGQSAASAFPKVVLTAPPTQTEVSNRAPPDAPYVLLTSHHPVFDIIYENNNSLQRAALSAPIHTQNGSLQSTQQVQMDHQIASHMQGHPVCAACRGLYQFLDGYYMPRVAEEVRRSPYLDSEDLSVNVNIPRGFSFIWLAAAAEFLRGALAIHIRASGAKPSPPTPQQRLPAFPEDYSSFKDLFTPDVRARVMSRLNKAEEGQSLGSKRLREEEALDEGPARPRCSQGFKYSLAGTNGVIVDIHAQLTAAEVLTGENSVADATGHGTVSGKQQHEQYKERTAAILPKEWCTNKGSAAGEPLQLFIIDDFVLPYLTTEDTHWKGRATTSPKDLLYEDDDNVTQKDSSSASNKWMCLLERDQWVLELDSSRGSFGGASQSSLLAPISCTVRHASIYIIGKYCKYMRGMAQSPWFSDGQRVGSFPLSLQEYIANPILPLFFPFGIPQPIAPPGTSASRASAAAELVQQLSSTSHVAAFKTAFNKERSSVAPLIDPITGAPLTSLENDSATNEGPSYSVQSSRPELSGEVRHKSFLGSPIQSIDPALIALHHVLGYGHYKFHTAGREDVDVRMLGTGRPFVLEIVSPHKEKIDFEAAQAAVGAFYGGAELVTIEDLAYTTPEVTVVMSKHSSEKQKVYRAVVYSSRPIVSDDDPYLVAANSTKDLVAQQSTPLRVLHRRSLLTRPKTIHSIRLERINNHWLIVDLTTQAGTYIKEFVHGDMGRTVPNLGTLLNSRTDIIQLDVLGMSAMEMPQNGNPLKSNEEADDDE